MPAIRDELMKGRSVTEIGGTSDGDSDSSVRRFEGPDWP